MIFLKNQYIEENKILHVRENRVDGKHKSKCNQYTSRQGVSKGQDPRKGSILWILQMMNCFKYNNFKEAVTTRNSQVDSLSRKIYILKSIK